MKRRNIVTAVAAVAGGVIAVSRLGTGMFGLLSGVNVAVLIAVAGVGIGKFLDNREDERMGFAVKDERTQLMEGRASSIGFRVGNFVWLALIYYDFVAENFMPWPIFESQEILLFGLLVNLCIYFAALFYHRKRG
ncbi:hypothetical protein DRO27_01265 [Candidatus Bathyarchaeota archaeon]|nr:MAG: hypothetical protein DRO27_01265 [Candidatus Bathyarchaeota archaeon]